MKLRPGLRKLERCSRTPRSAAAPKANIVIATAATTRAISDKTKVSTGSRFLAGYGEKPAQDEYTRSRFAGIGGRSAA